MPCIEISVKSTIHDINNTNGIDNQTTSTTLNDQSNNTQSKNDLESKTSIASTIILDSESNNNDKHQHENKQDKPNEKSEHTSHATFTLNDDQNSNLSELSDKSATKDSQDSINNQLIGSVNITNTMESGDSNTTSNTSEIIKVKNENKIESQVNDDNTKDQSNEMNYE